MKREDELGMTEEELAAQLRFATERAGPMLHGLDMAGAALMRQVTDGLASVLKAAAEGVVALRESCPAAFDDAGALRPDWQTIVQAKRGVALNPPQPAQRFNVRRVSARQIHVNLATNAVTVHLN